MLAWLPTDQQRLLCFWLNAMILQAVTFRIAFQPHLMPAHLCSPRPHPTLLRDSAHHAAHSPSPRLKTSLPTLIRAICSIPPPSNRSTRVPSPLHAHALRTSRRRRPSRCPLVPIGPQVAAERIPKRQKTYQLASSATRRCPRRDGRDQAQAGPAIWQ